jgi:hypothetical protein
MNLGIQSTLQHSITPASWSAPVSRILSIALLLAAAVILVGVLPYAAGYGPIKRTIL